ncbi:hypothetical protein F5888DRAFT_1639363 [Russula emetica]|nr:hypothetical protein F5888DRAFT_1639363 [Russula emetica]
MCRSPTSEPHCSVKPSAETKGETDKPKAPDGKPWYRLEDRTQSLRAEQAAGISIAEGGPIQQRDKSGFLRNKVFRGFLDVTNVTERVTRLSAEFRIKMRNSQNFPSSVLPKFPELSTQPGINVFSCPIQESFGRAPLWGPAGSHTLPSPQPPLDTIATPRTGIQRIGIHIGSHTGLRPNHSPGALGLIRRLPEHTKAGVVRNQRVLLLMEKKQKKCWSVIIKCRGGNGVQEPMPKTYIHILPIKSVFRETLKNSMKRIKVILIFVSLTSSLTSKTNPN